MTVEQPTADSQSVHVFPDTPKAITLSGSDPNDPPLPLTYTVTIAPLHGSISGLVPDLIFTPESGFTGTDKFVFIVDNGVTDAAEGNVYLTIGELESGEWSQTVLVKCPCDCPLPEVEVLYSERTNSGSGFGPWTDYGTAEFTASTDREVRVKIRIFGNGVACVVRFRQIFSFEDRTSRTVYTAGDLQVINVAADNSIQEIFYAFTPPGTDEESALVGAPGRATVNLMGLTQSAALKRKGFLAYTSGFGPPLGEAPIIYKKEEVLFGSNLGCPEGGRPPREYSGEQDFQPAAATDTNGWLADPAGLFNSSLSADLVEDNYASKPFGSIADAAEFGVTTYSEAEKDSVEMYICGKNTLEKILNLSLTEPYPPSDMIAAVDAAIDLQEINGAQVFVAEGSEVVTHRYFLSPGKTLYDRIHTTSIQADASVTETVLAYTDEAIIISLSCLATIRHFDGTGSTEAPMAFTALLYGDHFVGPVGPYGRGALTPVEAGQPDVNPQDNPWGDLGQQSVEVVLKDLKAKPHSLLVHKLLFAEPESVIAEGVDGM